MAAIAIKPYYGENFIAEDKEMAVSYNSKYAQQNKVRNKFFLLCVLEQEVRW